MSLPSASSLQIVQKCPGSTVLPHVRSLPTDAMAKGTNVHKFLELLGNGESRANALASVPEEFRSLCARIDTEGFPLGPEYKQEQGLAWDHVTGVGRFFEVEGRNYQNVAGTEFFGTSDVIGIFSDRVEVWDWKIGAGFHLSNPIDSMQLRFYAIAAARASGVNAARIGYIKINDDAEIEILVDNLDVFDLAIVEAELRDIALSVTKARAQAKDKGLPDVTPGPHCKYCPAFNNCPAQLGVLKRMLSNPKETIAELSDLHLAQAFPALEHAKKGIEDALKAIKESVRPDRPLDLGEGKQLAMVPTTRKEITDRNKALEVIAAKYSSDVAAKVVDRSVDITIIAMKEALEEVADMQGCSVSALYRELEKDLILSGAMKANNVSITRVVSTKIKGEK